MSSSSVEFSSGWREEASSVSYSLCSSFFEYASCEEGCIFLLISVKSICFSFTSIGFSLELRDFPNRC